MTDDKTIQTLKPDSTAKEAQPKPEVKPAVKAALASEPAVSPISPPQTPDTKPAPTPASPDPQDIKETKNSVDKKPAVKTGEDNTIAEPEAQPKQPEPVPEDSLPEELIKKEVEENIDITKPKIPAPETSDPAPLPQKTEPIAKEPEVISTPVTKDIKEDVPQAQKSAPPPSSLKEKVQKAPTPALTPKLEPIKRPIFSHQNLLDKLKEFRTKANQKRSKNKENNLEKIIKFALENNKITNDDVEKITGVKDSQAQRYLNLLVKQRRIVRFGKASNTFYKPIK